MFIAVLFLVKKKKTERKFSLRGDLGKGLLKTDHAIAGVLWGERGQGQ